MAVRRSFGDDRSAHRTSRATAIVDHELLLEVVAPRLDESAPHDIHRAARLEWHDHANRPIRERLAERCGADQQRNDQPPRQRNSRHDFSSRLRAKDE
jgi:hypothetical protein